MVKLLDMPNEVLMCIVKYLMEDDFEDIFRLMKVNMRLLSIGIGLFSTIRNVTRKMMLMPFKELQPFLDSKSQILQINAEGETIGNRFF